MKKIGIFCFLFFNYCAYSVSDEGVHSKQFLSKYENLPAEIETASLGLKGEFSFYFLGKKENERVLQIPLLLELQVPFGIENTNTKWLISAGAGWMFVRHKVCNPFFMPESPEPPFDTHFFQENFQKRLKEATDPETCFKSWEKTGSFPYLVIQPGLMHNFGSLSLVFKGGAFVGGLDKMQTGATANLSMGFSEWGGIGLNVLYYEDVYHVGMNITLGAPLKKWTIKNPYKY